MATRETKRIARNILIGTIAVALWACGVWLIAPLLQPLPRTSLAGIIVYGGSAVIVFGFFSRFFR